MCGFIAATSVEKIDLNLESLRDTIQHRGPDGTSSWNSEDRRFQSLFSRLAIIDIESSHQPFHTVDGRYTIVFNGEIYNYLELKKELQKLGVKFQTQGDTEVLLQSFIVWGENCVARIQGMFAFGVWDSKLKVCHFFRDHSGIKPLYWTKFGKIILFSSEIKPLLKLNPQARCYSEEGLDDFLSWGFVTGNETIFKGISKLAPGSTLKVSFNGEIEVRKLTLPKEARPKSTNLIEDLDSLFEESLKLHWRSDVKNGIFLSGGIDSSLMTCKLASLFGDGLNTYTLDFEEDPDSESKLAELVSQQAKTNHRTYRANALELLKNWSKVTWLLDEPLADSGALAQFYLSERVSEDKCKVLLSGTGADEIFAGYTYHVPSAREQKLNHFSGLLGPAGLLLGTEFGRKLKREASFFSEPIFNYLHRNLVFKLKSSKDFMSTLSRRGETFDVKMDPMKARLVADAKTYLLDDLLVLTDRMTMGASIEGRVPFLYQPLIDWGHSLDSNKRTPDFRRKGLLIDYASALIPAELLKRPKKGFNSPVAKWSKSPGYRRLAEHLLVSFKKRPWAEKVNLNHLNFHQEWLVLSLEMHCLTHIDQSPLPSQDLLSLLKSV